MPKIRTAFGSIGLALAAALLLGACAGALPAGLVRAEGAATGDTVLAADPLIEFTGTLESLDSHSATVAGKVFAILPETEIHGSLVLGDLVSVQAAILDGGDLLAREIGQIDGSASETESHDGTGTEFTGVVEAIAADAWTIDGTLVMLTPETEVGGGINVGDQVKVEATVGSDGSLTAREIKPIESVAPEDSGEDTEFTGIVEAIAADAWTVDGQVLIITPETEIGEAIQIGDLVKVEATLGSDGALTAKEIKPAESEDPEDMGEDSEFTGTVEAMAPDAWTIDGTIVTITAETEIEGEIKVGDLVKVEATPGSDGSLTAKEIKLADDSIGHQDGSDDDTETDEHSGGEEQHGGGDHPSTPEPDEHD